VSIALAFVLLKPKAKINSKAIVAKIAELFPDLPPATAQKSDTPGTISFDFAEDYSAILGLMPAPIPAGDLGGPIQTSLLWPDAEDAVSEHTGHLIVTVMDNTEGEDPIARQKILTMAVAGILATCNEAIGVYNGNATMLIRKDIFVDMASEILPEGMPLFLWISLRAGSNKDGTTSGFTVGMKELGHMEFETHNATDNIGELRERFMNLAGYVLENGPVIQDGNSVGADADEKIYVNYSPSEVGLEGDVMMLDYQPKKAKKRR
jgi:hypothetical protein